MNFMHWFGIFLFIAGAALAQDLTPSAPSSTATALPAASRGPIPWADWFKKNALVTDKKEYVHFFFNAQDFKERYQGENKNLMIAQTAAQLVAQLYPKTAVSDQIKMDIVFVTERDEYGLPKWDSLERVAHLEFLKSVVIKKGKPKKKFSGAEISKIFKPFELF